MKRIFFIFCFLFLAISVFGTEKVNINSASLEELKTLTGIGEVKAQAIIDARPFSSVDGLLNAKGIGEKTLQKIKEQGFACVNCETKIVEEKPTENSAEFSVGKSETVKAETKNYPTGIFINEIMSSAEGSDETGEWIEIYNSNSFEIDLYGWKIKDTAGTSKTFIVSDKKISGFGFLVFMRPETKITLNNDGDGIILQNPNGDIVDSVEFGKSSKGISFAKISDDWQWTNSPTPGFKNMILNQSDSKTLSKKEKSVNNIVAEDLTASIKKDVLKTNNPWFLFLTAIIIAIVSAVILLFIKFKLNKTNVRT